MLAGASAHGTFIALVLLVTAVASFDKAFLSFANICNMLGQWAPAGIMAVAMTFVVIARGFDLSLSSGFALCAIAAAATANAGYGTTVAFAAALATGLAIGCVNALLVCALSINPFIATVGTGFILLGLDFIATPNAYITVSEPGFDTLGAGSWMGLPFKGMFLIAALILGQFILARTLYGQALYAIGGNPEASRLSGLPVRTYTGITYLMSGLSMGVAGLLTASQLSSAQARMEPTIVFDVLAIVVVGGTTLAGGHGSVWRTAIGLAIIATISNGFTLLGLNPFYHGVVKGTVIILALAIASWAQRRPPMRSADDESQPLREKALDFGSAPPPGTQASLQGEIKMVTEKSSALPVKAGPVPFPMIPSRTALLVIDMQKDFLAPGGYVDNMGYSVEPLRKPIAPLQKLLETVRKTDILVIFTRYGKRPDLTDEPPSDIGRFASARAAGVEGAAIFGEVGPLGRLCIRGDIGWQIVDELLPLEGEPIVEKSTKSSFRFTDLELLLRNLGRDQLLVTGVTTDVCVTTTMRDGNDLGYACCLLADCCASADEKIHQSMLDQLPIQAGIFGWWSESGAVIDALNTAGAVLPDHKVPNRAVKDPAAYW